jgi:hypothetical protein
MCPAGLNAITSVSTQRYGIYQAARRNESFGDNSSCAELGF